MKFRPCIDLHLGQVKQIVGSTLSDDQPEALRTNFVSDHSPDWFAELYRRDNLRGGHIIMLGPGNEAAARRALEAWPGGMQIGGGITAENASYWLEQGASHVIVTSWVFRDGRIDYQRLEQLTAEVGKQRLVLDLSCRLLDGSYYIVTDRWQTFTRTRIAPETLAELASYCDEYLIHAADVEGKCSGIETALVSILAEHAKLSTTYAGGIRNIEDLEQIRQIGGGRIDATIGSALDIFGGDSITYREAVDFHYSQLGEDQAHE
jgi:phosphoribosylformimino-5-aminoimidazole carboxamide ribotide isomerase